MAWVRTHRIDAGRIHNFETQSSLLEEGKRDEMLNRVKKNLIVAVIAGTMCLALPSFAIDSTISYVNINNLAYQDIEVVINDRNQILVPFKQLADIFIIKYEANRVDKIIEFTTYDGRSGVINQHGIFVADEKISSATPIFIMQGIMDGVFNEAYIPADAASKIFDVQIETDFENLALNAVVNRDIPALKNNNILEVDENAPRAYADVAAPKKSGKITLKTIGLRNNLMNNNISTDFGANHSSYNNFSGATMASINGDLFSGKYRVEATEYHYKNDAFMFGGLSATYRNKIKNKKDDKEYFYELGRVGGVSDEDAQIGTNIFGAQVWTYDNQRRRPNEICGYVKPTSLVRMTVNDLEPITLSTYAGYYSLRGVQLPNPVKSIKLEEVNEDGTVELISDEKFPIYGDRPFENEGRGTAFAGVWGYQNRLFREGANIYRGNNKKATVGGEYQFGVRDNVTFKSKISGDKIYEKSNAKIIYNVPTNDSLLVVGTQKSVNYYEGATSLNTLEWQSKKNQYIKARAVAGASVAHDIRAHFTHAGYIGKLVGEYDQELTKYKKDLTKYHLGIFKPRKIKAKAELFNSSPDFYIASSDSTSKNDRTGGKVSLSGSFNQTSVGGSYSRYFSNMNHRYQGGTLTFDEADISANTKIPYVATVQFSGNYRHGKNNLGRNKNYFYDGGVEREFANVFRIASGYRESLYDTRFDVQTQDSTNYYSKFTDIYINTETVLPQDAGRFQFGHDFINYKTLSYKDGYNIFRFGYTFPTWKNWTLNLAYGFRYAGQKGNEFGVTLGHRAKSGQYMSVGYHFTQNGGYFINNMFVPTTNSHAINFTFNDAFQVFHRGFKSVGNENLNKGLFEAIAFVDIDGDGKYTRKVDIPMKDIPLETSWGGEENVTNKNGRVYSSSLEQGIYTVSLNMDELPMTVAPVSNDMISRKVKIDGGKTTVLEVPLVSTVGSVSGTLKITDDYERNLRITDFVVVLLDSNGEEVNYSTVGDSGEFYISGLAPGSYTLRLDERYIDAYGLEELSNSTINVLIPYDYNNPTDITDQLLEYKTLAL